MQIKVSFSNGSNFDKFEKKVKQLFNTVKDDTLKSARANTPIKSGRARNAWTASKKRNGFSVNNTTPYIGKLERGSSRQAPAGITKPTLKQLANRLTTRRIIR